MTAAHTLRLKVRQIDQFCVFDLSGGDRLELSATLKYPPHLNELYQNWQQIYCRRYQLHARAGVGNKSGSGTPMDYDWDQELRIAETALLTEFAYWLGQAELLPLREAIQRCVDKAKSPANQAKRQTNLVDVLIECDPIDLARLPWETWTLTPASREPGTICIARTSPTTQPATKVARSQQRQVRVLAILADAPDLNHEFDHHALSSLLPLATIEFLHCSELAVAHNGSPGTALKQHIAQAIDDPRGWDLLFFSGHSDETTITGGKLELAPQITLSMRDIEPQLLAAIYRGLQLAVFNSCSGLSIADSLIRLGVPQVVVMREQIQDAVAHKFLQQFCTSLARYNDVQQATLQTVEYFAAENISYPSMHLVPSLFRHPDPTVPLFQIEPSTLKRVWQRWQPTRWQAIALSTLAFFSSLVPLQELLFELRYTSQAVYRQATHQFPVAKPPTVTVLQIDQASIDRKGIDAYKIKPMSRAYLAELVGRLRQLNVKTIGIDYVLDGTTKEDGILAKAVQQAIQQQAWFVFPTYQNDAGQLIQVSSTIANPNWILQGDIDILNWHVMLPETLPCRAQCPFPYQLAVAHSLRSNSNAIPSVAPLANLQQQVNQTRQHAQPTHQTHSFLQQPERFWGLQPVIDFSLPPDHVYDSIAAWDFLERPLTDPRIQALQNQVVIIGSGGYDRAEDNFAAPLAVRYWRSFKEKSQSSQETLRSQVLPGAFVHAYSVHHILSQHLLRQVPTLWLLGIAVILGKGATQLLATRKQQEQPRLLWWWLGGTGLYGVLSLQSYVTVAIVLPWFLPSMLFWLYVLPAFKRTNDL
jgi:CHASE2 domain-containing sensor protein